MDYHGYCSSWEFQPDSESWSAYVECIKLYFMANNISNSKKVLVFLSLIRAKHYELIRNLLNPTPPKEKSFDVLVKTLKKYFEPTLVVGSKDLNSKQQFMSSFHSRIISHPYWTPTSSSLGFSLFIACCAL